MGGTTWFGERNFYTEREGRKRGGTALLDTYKLLDRLRSSVGYYPEQTVILGQSMALSILNFTDWNIEGEFERV